MGIETTGTAKKGADRKMAGKSPDTTSKDDRLWRRQKRPLKVDLGIFEEKPETMRDLLEPR